jgi:hypothetical protein
VETVDSLPRSREMEIFQIEYDTAKKVRRSISAKRFHHFEEDFEVNREIYIIRLGEVEFDSENSDYR